MSVGCTSVLRKHTAVISITDLDSKPLMLYLWFISFCTRATQCPHSDRRLWTCALLFSLDRQGISRVKIKEWIFNEYRKRRNIF